MGHADLGYELAARERWVDQRADSLIDHLINLGSMSVTPMWALADGKVPVSVDFIAWLHECRNGNRDVAVCMYAPNTTRLRLFVEYAEERAQRELDALPADHFSEVA
jgi:hypothetical protein